jgi:TatD DNase family protein
MNLPKPDDYINIHTHHGMPGEGIFTVENLMAHENLSPDKINAEAFTAGIHPWHLNKNNQQQLVEFIFQVAGNSNLIAIGEAGFDKLRGPGMELQKLTFEEQVKIAEEYRKPIIIHCVRAWDVLLASHRNLKPSTKWLVHGFRGKKELAVQLLSRGMYLSFWFDFVLRPESSELSDSCQKTEFFLKLMVLMWISKIFIKK